MSSGSTYAKPSRYSYKMKIKEYVKYSQLQKILAENKNSTLLKTDWYH